MRRGLLPEIGEDIRPYWGLALQQVFGIRPWEMEQYTPGETLAQLLQIEEMKRETNKPTAKRATRGRR
ncbi:MAG: hypothetical protein IT175_06165 [Acidobacteria bacterium]|nr:hypothetical protein [Acidobacteriota bacterium]